jgi:DNA-binding protein HU-beta
VNKSDLIARMTERLGGDRDTAVAAVNGVLEEIEGGVARGERVSLTGFGTFDRRERAPRTGRNPRTGEAIQVGPSVAPVFRAGAGFRTLLSPAGGGSVSSAVAVEVPVEAAAGKAKAGKKVRVQPAGKKAKPTNKPSTEAAVKPAKKAGKSKGKKADRSLR